MPAAQSGSRGQMQLLRDRESILKVRPILEELAAICEQPGAADDLDYRLAYHRLSPGAQRKSPCLVLIPAECGVGDPGKSVAGYAGALLLFEYRLPGVGLRLYTTTDTTGRRTLIAPEAYRARMAAYAAREMIAGGAAVVLSTIELNDRDGSVEATVRQELCHAGRGLSRVEWAVAVRENPVYLRLKPTFDETMTGVGKKTRTQLRYYRRRAERELGSRFITGVDVGVDEFLAFSRRCMYAVPDKMARWRFKIRETIEEPFLHGVQDGKGNWLAMAGGRRTGDFVEIEWQCNRADLPASSLATVMLSYLIQHEAEAGMKRMYFEGGTTNSLQQSFVVEGAVDLTVCRRSAYVWLLRRLARWIFPANNQMARILINKGLEWKRC